MKFRVFRKTEFAAGNRKKGRATIVFAAALLCAATLAGCKQSGQKSFDAAALADDLKNTVPFSDSLSELSDAAFGSEYTIEPADIAVKKIYVSSGATAEEVAVFEAKDETAAGRILTDAKTHIQDQIDAYTNYNTVELKKLNDPVIEQNGKYVIICISDHNDTAKTCINKYIK